VRCANCGTLNPAGFKFCGECGQPLAATCPNCDAAVTPGMKFCGECGHALGQGAASAAATTQPAAAERRLVTVLFADLVGFTTASQNRDPDEVREMLGRYFEVCRRLVELYGGSLEKFIGDAVMAVWGTPVANEDDAERAVRSALDIVDAVQALGEEIHRPDLRARAAVLTGEAAVNLKAVGQGMVAGDLVNTASRLQGVAPPGAVLVGEGARRLTEASIVYEDFGEHALKGRDEPVHAWRALRVVAARGGSQRSNTIEPPFVGRDRELRLLKELFHASVDESRAHLVSVTGIAGIGKSRLAWEFFKYVDGLAGTIRWHAGRCLAYGEGVTYWALAEMVRTRAGILEAEAGEPALAKLRAALESSIPDAEERRWLEPRLAQLVGLQEPGAADRQDLFAAWRRFYERLSEELPTVMLFEDMQWADPSLVEFIDYLLDWSRDHRIFIVTLGRAGDAHGESQRAHTALHLEPLARPAMELLITAVVPGLSPELVTQIMERAEGVPLYAVETIRMLLDRGLLVREGSAYHPSEAIASLEVPESLHTLIAARLDGLDATERQVLKQCAVLGKTFTAAALTAVSGRSATEVNGLLAGLLRKEVLSVRSDPRSPERGQYAFLQDLVRQVAYETLSRRDRRELHLLVASYLEASFGTEEEIVEVLAAHYLAAYREIPDAADAAAIRQRACSMLARAGERAASLAASEEAQGYFERAIELAGSDLERAELEVRAGLMAWQRGRLHDANAFWESAKDAFEGAGDHRRSALVEVRRGELYVQEGSLRVGAERMQAAYAVIAGTEPEPATAAVASQIARMLTLMDRYDEALPYIETALQIAEDLRLPEVISQALNTKAIGLMYRGRHEEASLLLKHALDLALKNNLWSAAFRAYNNIAVELYYADRHREGLQVCASAFDLAKRIGDRSELARALSSKLGYLQWLGRWDEELEVARQTEEIAGPEVARSSWLANRFISSVEILCERGRIEEARALADVLKPARESDQTEIAVVNAAIVGMVLHAEGRDEEALRLVEAAWHEKPVNPAHPAGKQAWPLLMECAFAIGDLNRVQDLLDPVLAIRPGQTPPSLDGLRTRYKARLERARGHDERFEEAISSAAAIFARTEMPFLQAGCLLELVEWRPDHAHSQDWAADARDIFERLKARPWLDRLDRVTAAPRA
jgi:class 3 adenylate cyclase/tetratricopeptide (TPR) repeat protein